MVVAWSPKSACSHVALWSLPARGPRRRPHAYHAWPHEYRTHVYYKTGRFRRLAQRRRRRRPRPHPAQGHPRPGQAAGVDLPPRLPLPVHGRRSRRRLGIDIATAGHLAPRLRRGARRLPLVAPTSADPHICAQYHPVWDWGFDRVITLNIDQIAARRRAERPRARLGSRHRLRRACRLRRAAAKRTIRAGARFDIAGPIEDHRFQLARSAASRSGQIMASPLIRQHGAELPCRPTSAAPDAGRQRRHPVPQRPLRSR